jgi:hypothetical protein
MVSSEVQSLESQVFGGFGFARAALLQHCGNRSIVSCRPETPPK